MVPERPPRSHSPVPARFERGAGVGPRPRPVLVLTALAVVVLASSCNGLAFGRGTFGRLGDGTGENRSTPAAVSSTEEFAVLDGGDQHSCGITAGGALYCWGTNLGGRLGVPNEAPLNRLSPVPVGTATDWTTVSAGGSHTCGIRDHGKLFCWGENFDGQAKPGDSITVPEPTRIGSASTWISVSAGQRHTCGIREVSNGAGQLLCWGFDGDGRNGNGPVIQPNMTQVGTATDWVQVSASLHTCGLRTTGRLFCWGGNADGQLGIGSLVAHHSPIQLTSDNDWTQVAAGERHTCAIRSGGGFCWGSNTFGQLGTGTFDGTTRPVAVVGRSGFTQVSVGGFHSCAIAASELFCWGQNLDGQLGDGTTINRPAIGAPTLPDPVEAVSAGRQHTLVVT